MGSASTPSPVTRTDLGKEVSQLWLPRRPGRHPIATSDAVIRLVVAPWRTKSPSGPVSCQRPGKLRPRRLYECRRQL